MDNVLKPIPIEDWHLLRDLLKRQWPKYIKYYYWLNNAIRWMTTGFDKDLYQIYCPNGKYETGTFIGVLSLLTCRVVIFSFEETKELLQKSILDLPRVIHWSEVIFCAVHENLEEVLSESLKQMNILTEFSTVTICHYKTKEDCAQQLVEIPPEVYVENLDLKHVKEIHSVWPHRDKKNPELSFNFLYTLVEYNGGLGLFLKDNDRLVAWVLHSEWDGLSMLQTIDDHKKKGYGAAIVRAASKGLATEHNIDTALDVVEDNAAALKLFKSLGYQSLHKAVWVHTLGPKEKKSL
ncbi:uncharacterized protein LOC106648714 [Trichogramma pretiosum]|uniref:uncharacterized protein LOC106648714 n=1 Tax=Trichogramma pretiosum TaxID=7493 RepID=UPI0006C9A72D|nr:uncharacterized protein LOC106648714 [Trichogramma pretiosum]XP_023314734.1 uncharacterized protein LOC106648714 [Trichogramma pretiosum]